MNDKKNPIGHSHGTSRRNWLKTIGLLSGGLFASRLAHAELADSIAAPAAVAKRSLRFAQISDIHLQPELGATEGFVKCLHHIQSQREAPGLILNTGDCIMDSMAKKNARTKLQWDLWAKVLREDCSLPIEHTIGNHDCWGLNKIKSGTTGEEALWGKHRAMDQLGLKKPFRSFDRNGWHFIVLDSVEPFENSYKARLGEEQLAWLKSDLTAVSKGVPILVSSHIPIISPSAILTAAKETPDHDLDISGGSMHLDSAEIHNLLREQGNVKLCLSGHLHTVDRAEFDGITYITSGAVSSGWWKKINLDRFDYGYAMVDLFTDGTFNHQYVPYGWKTVVTSAVDKEKSDSDKPHSI